MVPVRSLKEALKRELAAARGGEATEEAELQERRSAEEALEPELAPVRQGETPEEDQHQVLLDEEDQQQEDRAVPTDRVSQKHGYRIFDCDTGVSLLTARRCMLVAGFVSTSVDSVLDGLVATKFYHQRLATFATLLVVSIVVPQVLAWAFLSHYQMALHG